MASLTQRDVGAFYTYEEVCGGGGSGLGGVRAHRLTG